MGTKIQINPPRHLFYTKASQKIFCACLFFRSSQPIDTEAWLSQAPFTGAISKFPGRLIWTFHKNSQGYRPVTFLASFSWCIWSRHYYKPLNNHTFTNFILVKIKYILDETGWRSRRTFGSYSVIPCRVWTHNTRRSRMWQGMSLNNYDFGYFFYK